MTDVKRVLVVVFDGLQPAQITPQLMPNLSEFARTGVTLSNHHPVFPTVTRVNASSLVTGCLPGKHGLAVHLELEDARILSFVNQP
ncbi:MAG: alkaline phosphatase family protein, partial [Chloroflexi bacterium]|nr:alkaline phosphatase family protein [Chloroflexota bacterium]